MVGIQSHGQGLETALSQIAAEELGIDPARIAVRHGDAEISAFGFGTFASCSMVMTGGAVARAGRTLRDKLTRIGAHLLQSDPAEVRYADGAVWGATGIGHGRRDCQGRASADGWTAAGRRSAA
jgi:carbon-monoxide dehydrogenase large subunit